MYDIRSRAPGGGEPPPPWWTLDPGTYIHICAYMYIYKDL